MSYSEPKELIRAKKLIEKGHLDGALQILDSFGERKNLLFNEQISYYTIRSLLAFSLFDKNACIEYAEKAYNASEKLENSLQLLDVYIQMASGLIWQFKINKAKEFIQKSENLLKILPKEPSTEIVRRRAYILYVKGYICLWGGDLEKAKKFAEIALKIQEELDLKGFIALSLLQLGQISRHIGDLNRAQEYIESCKVLADDLNSIILTKMCHLLFGIIFSTKGELDKALNYNKQVLTFAEKENDKELIASMLNNIGMIYQEKGDFDKALENMEKSLESREEIGDEYRLSAIYDSIFHLALIKKDFEQALLYLNKMKEISDQSENVIVNLTYRIDSAVYMKYSPRTLNRGKAEEILKQLIEEGIPNYELRVISLLNLCDLLLFELGTTNEAELLEELQFYFSLLFDTVKNTRSYSLLAEIYLLQARLALITLDMKKARQFLAKAQEIAEKYGLSLLAIKISSEHDQLLNQLDLWEKLRDSKASIKERIELARLNDQIGYLLKKKVLKAPKLEAEQPVLIAIMAKEGDLILSRPFTADMTIDENRFGEFLSSCNTFCDQIFSESFDRVKFGQYTILITAVDPVCVYYMFLGRSYSAQHKLDHFCEAIKKNASILNILKNGVNLKEVIEIDKYPILDGLIVESFLSDPQQFKMPFKAYEGDEKFVFVSYSHTDRLQVYPIIDYLNKTGINIWYDEGISVSEDWKNSVVDNLERCNTFLVFITPHIIDSEYVRKEISFALKKQKPFFSVYLKETQLPSKLEFEIGDIQFMKKYLMPETEFYNKLNRMLNLN